MQNKSILAAVFTVVAILMSFDYGIAIGQNTTSLYPNNTETIQEFEQIEGNNTQIFDNDTNISNPSNNLEDSLQINQNESN
jgi:hypothetical protein